MDSATAVPRAWGTFDLVIFKLIWAIILCTCVKMACTSKTSGHRMTRSKMWDSETVLTYSNTHPTLLLYSYDKTMIKLKLMQTREKIKNSNANILHGFHVISAKLSSTNSGNVGVLLIKFSGHLANIKDFVSPHRTRRDYYFQRDIPPNSFLPISEKKS